MRICIAEIFAEMHLARESGDRVRCEYSSPRLIFAEIFAEMHLARESGDRVWDVQHRGYDRRVDVAEYSAAHLRVKSMRLRCGSDAVQMQLRCGTDTVQMRLRCSSDAV